MLMYTAGRSRLESGGAHESKNREEANIFEDFRACYLTHISLSKPIHKGKENSL